MSAAVPASLTPHQARLWRTTRILAFLGLVSLALVAAKSTIDDRCGPKAQYLKNNVGDLVSNNLGQLIEVGPAYECRLSEQWTIRFREGFPFIGLDYDRLPEFTRPL